MKALWTSSTNSSVLKGTVHIHMEACHQYAVKYRNMLIMLMLILFRIGEPEEIGGVIAFLCTEEASYITGETIAVTGGMGCRL